MSPVSRGRKHKQPKASRPPGRTATAMRLRHQAPFDVLARELVKLAAVEDAFTIEGVGTFLFDVLDERGSSDTAFETFCRGVVDDPRAATSVLGLQALALVADLGHPDVRAEAAGALAAAPADLVAQSPSWLLRLGRVHVVEAGALRTADGRETVLHVLLDYDDADAGSRHLLTIAVQHEENRVYLLDVRGREAHDALGPMAEAYTGSSDPVWTWLAADDLADLVEDAVRLTSTRPDSVWPVIDVDNGRSVAWALGVRRLEQVGGRALR